MAQVEGDEVGINMKLVLLTSVAVWVTTVLAATTDTILAWCAVLGVLGGLIAGSIKAALAVHNALTESNERLTKIEQRMANGDESFKELRSAIAALPCEQRQQKCKDK